MTNVTEITPTADKSQSAVWKIVSFPLTLLILGEALVAFPALYLASIGPNYLQNAMPWLVLPWTIASVTVTWLLYRAFKRWIERAPDRELAFETGWLKEVLGGLAIGTVLFSAIVGAVALLGGLTVTGMGSGTSFFRIAALSLAAGINEEVMFRAIGFRFAEKLGGSLVAIVLTSLLFGVAHLANPGASYFAAIAIAAEAGVMLGGAYMVTRRLWLAVGIHAGWNFTQGWLWSVPVSGNAAGDGLFLTERHGADWLTGGAFGLEASAVTMAVATLFGLAMLVVAVRRGHWVPLGWLPGRAAA
jgi:membrane protease YdiL (CAAX protease family)